MIAKKVKKQLKIKLFFEIVRKDKIHGFLRQYILYMSVYLEMF